MYQSPDKSAQSPSYSLRKMRTIALRAVRTYISHNQVRFDLGIRDLLPQWKEMLRPQFLREDLVAGLNVACVAIPLSIAIALASEVPPGVGLITAIVAGIVCAFFGGTKLSVSGPAAAMAILIATISEQHGTGGLLAVGFIAGCLQLFAGFFGFAKLAKFVPLPVVSGFTAGIGAIILIGQLPRALGLPSPDHSHIFEVVRHIFDFISHTNFGSLGLTVTTLVVCLGLPRLLPRAPAPLIALVVTTILANLLHLNTIFVEQFPSSLPLPKFPQIPFHNWISLLGSGFVVFAVASLETFLSAGAIDKQAKKQRHEPNQELVGQGLGNMVVALFGGIPVTNVIARSAVNIRSGARTRRASIFHSIFILLCVYVFSPLTSHIPVAALAGLLIAIAFNMLHPEEFLHIWRTSRPEAVTFLTTFLAIVFFDLFAGVQIGIGVAVVLFLIQLANTGIRLYAAEGDAPHRLVLNGSLSLLSSVKIEQMRDIIRRSTNSKGLVIDGSKLAMLDASGAELLLELIEEVRTQGIRVALKSFSQDCGETLVGSDATGTIENCFALTETEVSEILQNQQRSWGRENLLIGVERFRRESRGNYRNLFQKLAEGQNPHTLFITCSDSRIDPNLVTSAEPGEVFIIRNAGNVLPAFGEENVPIQGASLEFAVGVLGVRDIIVCGHSSCGAMKGIIAGGNDERLPALANYLKYLQKATGSGWNWNDPDQVSKENVKLQIQNIKSYPIIQQKLASNELRIFGWFYDVQKSEFSEWDHLSQSYSNLTGTKIPMSIKRTIS